MAAIKDKAYFDFSGGIKRNKSPIALKDNELQRGRNFEIDDIGRLTKRRGSIQFGNSLINIVQFHNDNNGLYAADYNATELNVYKLKSTTNDAALAIGATSIAVSPSGQLTAAGSAEIDGDAFDYSAGGGGATLTGVTGIDAAHTSIRAINHWQDLGAFTNHISLDGVWFTYLNALTVVLSNDGATNSDMSTINSSGSVSAVSSMDVNARLLETFRDRVFTTLNNIVYYSNLGVVVFPATIEDNSFEIEDQSGETITAIKQYRKNLLVFKPSSSYAYSGSLPVRQLTTSYGVYNDNCIQEINGILYGFGPKGVWASNGVSFVNIGEPIKDYLNLILWQNLATNVDISRIRTGFFDNKFIIFTDFITDPDTTLSLSGTALIYDTLKKSWSMWTGVSAFGGFKGLGNFRSGNAGLLQNRSALFFTDGTVIWRMFENRFIERVSSSGAGIQKGSDVYADEFRNGAGLDITFNVLTKPFDLGLPQYYKEFGYLKVMSERPQGLQISVVIDDGDPIPLGKVTKKIERFQFPVGTRGYRCALLLDENSTNQSLIFNGCIFEECKTIDKQVNA